MRSSTRSTASSFSSAAPPTHPTSGRACRSGPVARSAMVHRGVLSRPVSRRLVRDTGRCTQTLKARRWAVLGRIGVRNQVGRPERACAVLDVCSRHKIKQASRNVTHATIGPLICRTIKKRGSAAFDAHGLLHYFDATKTPRTNAQNSGASTSNTVQAAACDDRSVDRGLEAPHRAHSRFHVALSFVEPRPKRRI
jgi:hypothetical protein